MDKINKTNNTHAAYDAHGTHTAHSAHSTHSTHSAHTAHSAHTTHSAHSTHSTHTTHDAHTAHGTHAAYDTHTAHSAHGTHGAAADRSRPAPLVYLAGPLFSSAERTFNKTLRSLLESAGYAVFLPQEDAEDTDEERSDGGLRSIFERCLDGLCRADIVVAVLDGVDVDSGTAWEIGCAYSQKKPIVGLRTDFRICGEREPVNLMILESLTCCAKTADELPACVEKAAALLK